MSGREEAEKVNTSPSINAKTTSESKALDLLQQHANQYHSKSPAVSLLLLLLKSTMFWGRRGDKLGSGLEIEMVFEPGCDFKMLFYPRT